MLTMTLFEPGVAEGIPNAFCRWPNRDGAQPDGGPT